MKKALGVILLLPMLVIISATVYLRTSDLSELRPYVARFVSKLLRRELTINGQFTAEIGRNISVHVTNVTLAKLATANDVQITIDPISFFNRPIRFLTATVTGATLTLEKFSDGSTTWDFRAEVPGKRFPIQIDHLIASHVDVTYTYPTFSPVHLRLEEGEAQRIMYGRFSIDRFRATWETNRVTAHGLLTLPELTGSDLTVEGAGPDVSPLAALFKIRLPKKPFTLSGRVQKNEEGFRFERFLFSSSGHQLSLNGPLGKYPKFSGTDFSFEISGPDLSPLSAWVPSLPSGRYSGRGQIKRLATGIRFRRFNFRVGKVELALAGISGNAPLYEPTDLEVKTSGPSLLEVSQMFNGPDLPDERFEFSGRLKGNPKHFGTDAFHARLGKTDARGSFQLDLTKAPPEISCDLSSDRVDLSVLNFPSSTKSEEKSKTFIPEIPLYFDGLRKINGHVTWKAGTIWFGPLTTNSVAVDMSLKDGTLEVARAEGQQGGQKINFSFLLEPVPSAYRIKARAHGEKLQVKSLQWTGPDAPRVNADLDFDGTGTSIRDLAMKGRGYLFVDILPGVITTKLSELFTRDILKTLAGALNPFKEESESVKVECAVIATNLKDGVAKLDGFAARTNTTTMVGDGKVETKSEKLEFEWVAKPRSGIGLSASSLSEPYIKLGGTLLEPKMKIEPVSATVSTGAAVMTMGLSLVAKGVWNRISAEDDVCSALRTKYAPKEDTVGVR